MGTKNYIVEASTISASVPEGPNQSKVYTVCDVIAGYLIANKSFRILTIIPNMIAELDPESVIKNFKCNFRFSFIVSS